MERGNPFFAQRKILSSNMVEMIGKALLFAFKFKMLDILWIEKKPVCLVRESTDSLARHFYLPKTY